MEAVYLLIGGVVIIVLMAVGVQMLQTGYDEIPAEAQGTAAANGTAGTLELMGLGTALLPVGLFGLAFLGVFLAIVGRRGA